MTKPGNSGSEEPKQAERSTEPAADDTAETRPEDTASPRTSATQPESPAQAHESPTGAPGGPPDSTLPESTDNSGAQAKPNAAEPAEAEPAKAKAAAAKPATEASETEDAEPKAAEPAEAKPAEAKPAAAESADDKPAAAKPAKAKPAAKARKTEDLEPLMAELEKAPPAPREPAVRAKAAATRGFDEPPPRTLRFSFYFFAAAGLVWLLSGIVFLINKQTIVDAQVEANDRSDITADQIASAVNQLLWFYVIIALVFAAFLGLFGWKATEGTRRARTLVTIFSAILVIFHLLLFSTQFGVLSALLALIGLVLIWSRSARAYFPSRQQLS